MNAKELAEKICWFIWDKRTNTVGEPIEPDKTIENIESLLKEALNEFYNKGRKDEHDGKKTISTATIYEHEREIEQAKAAAYEEGYHAGIESSGSVAKGLVEAAKISVYEECAKIAENVRAEPMDEGNDPCHCVTYELTPSMIADKIRQRAKEMK